MKRREFIAGLGATLAAPRSVEAQGIAMRRVGILSGLAPDDPQSKARLAAFQNALAALGWQEGRNLRADTLQTGVGNVSGIAQIGTNHTAVADQDGDNNTSGIIQVGNGQDVTVRQRGEGNISVVVQSGYN